MNDTLESNDVRRGFSVSHGSYFVRTTFGEMRLNDNESPFEDDATEVTFLADPEKVKGETLTMFTKFSDDATLKASAQAEMTIEEAKDVHERLGEAIEAAEEHRRYHDR